MRVAVDGRVCASTRTSTGARGTGCTDSDGRCSPSVRPRCGASPAGDTLTRPQHRYLLNRGPCALQEEDGNRPAYHTCHSFMVFMWVCKTNLLRNLLNRFFPDLPLSLVTVISYKRHSYSFLPWSTVMSWSKTLLVTKSWGDLISFSEGLNLFEVSCKALETGYTQLEEIYCNMYSCNYPTVFVSFIALHWCVNPTHHFHSLHQGSSHSQTPQVSSSYFWFCFGQE